MNTNRVVDPGFLPVIDGTPVVESSDTGTSWGAIFAGAVTAAALSLILLVFGTGFGLGIISPWNQAGASAATFTLAAAIWLIVVQWVSSAFGGYMAGRLRSKWAGIHSDEMFFRDTAHGFLAWCLATLIVFGVLAMAASSLVDNGTKLAGASAGNQLTNNYYVDLLFRHTIVDGSTAGSQSNAVANGSADMVTGMSDQETRAEAAAILAKDIGPGTVLPEDTAYLTQLVSARTGLAPADAAARVRDVFAREQADFTKAKKLVDDVRKASSGAAIYTFIALLIGAFIASIAGAIGGHFRSRY